MRLVFDRGTLLLVDPPPDLEPGGLPGVLWDPRVRALRAPAHLRADLARALAGRGVALDPDPPRPSPGPWGPVDLRPYQAAALAAWESGGRRGVVALPTGAGKTRLALAAAATTGLSTLVLVPTRVLLEQWHAAASGLYRGHVGRLGDGVVDVAPVTIATFESGWRRMGALGDRFDLLIVDEVHHLGRGQRDEVLEMSVAAARLGLTATPSEDPAAVERLARLLGPVVYSLGVRDLAGTWLAPFDQVTYELELTPDERRRYEADRATFQAVFEPFRRACPGATWPEFQRAAGRSDAGRRALVAWRRTARLLAFTRAKADAFGALLARHREARVLVFTADNASAYAVARTHLVAPITCDIDRTEREDLLARFARGDLRALVSARVLNEGLDVPDADVAIVVGGTLGAREHVQRVGRLLRPASGKRALIYELISRDTTEARQARRRSRGLAS